MNNKIIIKPYPKVENLEEDFKYTTFTEKGKVKYEALPVRIVVQYILNAKMVGKYFYKDYANFDHPFESDKGFIKVFDEKLGIWKIADTFIKDKIDEFFTDEETKDIINCCRFAMNKDTRTSDNKILFVSVVHEMNKVLKKLGNHWNTSFEKGYLPITFKNGTLFLNAISGKTEFKEEKDPNFLAEIYFNTKFDPMKLDRENRLFKFLKEKVNLNTREKENYFKALIFDYFYTENESHHTIFFIGKNASGKSSFMKHLVGFANMNECTKVVDLQRMIGERFTNPNWFQYPFIFTNETKEKFVEDNATFKQMVAKEELTLEQKGKDPITMKPFGKIIGLGEQPFRMRIDGGADQRIINHFFREEKLEFSKEEINQYKEYYKQIEEKDLTRNDELLQYLAFEKYEDLTDLLIQGLYSFCEGEYSKGRRTFKKKYEELFADEVEEFGKLQSPYLVLYQYFFEPDPNSFISSTALLKIIELLEISNIGTTKALREQLEMVNKKLFGFDVRFFKSETKDVKISIVENLKSYGKETGKFEIKEFTLPRRTVWIFGLKLKSLEEIEEMIANNKNLIQSSRNDKYASLKISFKEIEETSYKKIFPVADLTKKSNEEIVDSKEEFPF
ncbi:hypothetical protein HUW76_10780 (plasmid) [Fusobacterium animalis]|uniref:NrS-1 polymerase-like helicase domain-containing protein n=1 Tax=Fusobacterium animalis 4_8 TaxID=469607 RepID=R9RES9_9FUSO|nr:DUF5906 domain-containing protein [Fusobacterium animalis]AGM24585.1 hypothetical protein HMPREF0409_03014 [Fusobacterium animalis 4_8]